jgi:hypothetical protein
MIVGGSMIKHVMLIYINRNLIGPFSLFYLILVLLRPLKEPFAPFLTRSPITVLQRLCYTFRQAL